MKNRLNLLEGDGGDLDLFSDPSRFMNRELSWLEFNRRVLEEAENKENPLLERIRFLSISANNLDEFIMVRVAGLSGQIREGVEKLSADGRTPKEQFDEVLSVIKILQHDQQQTWRNLAAKLEGEGVRIVKPGDVNSKDVKSLEAIFIQNVFPILTPLSMDPAHPFPFIPNLGQSLMFDLSYKNDGQRRMALIRLPDGLRRFVQLPSTDPAKPSFVSIEDLVGMFIGKLFPGHKSRGSGNFRVIRDSDIELEEEAEDLVRTYETALKRRRRGSVVHLEIDSGMPENLRDFVISVLGSEGAHVSLDRKSVV